MLLCCAIASESKFVFQADDTSDTVIIDSDEAMTRTVILTVTTMITIVTAMMTMLMYCSGQVNKYALPVVQRLLLQDVSASAQELVRLGDTLLHGRHKHCRV